MEEPVRRPNRLKAFDYSAGGVYFVTLCVKDRKNLLWTKHAMDISQTTIGTQTHVGANCVRPHETSLSHIGRVVESELKKWDKTYHAVRLDKYVVMPNHIHILIRIMSDENGRALLAPTIGRAIQQMKGAVTKQIGCSIWQRSFHDHVVRDERDYLMIWDYIDTNPVKWALDRFYCAE